MKFYKSLVVTFCLFVLVHCEAIESDTPEEASLQCSLCVNRYNWTSCDEAARSRVCSEALVKSTHSYLSQFNPGLNKTLSNGTNVHQFRCFLLELEIDVSTVNVFIRGCTYDNVTFCEGWNANGAKATNCVTCSDGMCERNATWDAFFKTTTTVEPITTTMTSSTTQSLPVPTTKPTSVSTTTLHSPVTESSSDAGIITTTDGVTQVVPGIDALNCTECGSAVSWEDCQSSSQIRQCSTGNVNELHSDLLKYNPGLPVGNYSQFKCFRIKGSYSGIVLYKMGCTFASARFCARDEWRNATVMECSKTSHVDSTAVITLGALILTLIFGKLNIQL